MLLSELFGDAQDPIQRAEHKFLQHARSLWAAQFEAIVRESRGPQIKTRIVVKKGNKDGNR